MLFPEEHPSSPLAAISSENLIDTDFLRTIKRGLELSEKYPELLEMISDDQTKHGLKKKLSREQDQNWNRQNSHYNSLLPIESETTTPKLLQNTKERMPPGLVLVFLLIRGFLGNIKSRKNSTFLFESKAVDILVTSFGLPKFPGLSTILDNLNLLSEETVREILIRSLTEAKQFDDFSSSYFDSTRISADSAWPTESKTINDLLRRISQSFVILREHGIKVNLPADLEETKREIDSLQKGIALISGKKNSKKAIKKSIETF